MRLDIFTIFVLMATICLLSAVGFGIGWWKHRSERVLAYSAATFGLGAVSTLLLAARGRIPDLLSVDVANAAVFAAMALGWNSFREMNGRRFLVLPVILPCVVWLILSRYPGFYEETWLRSLVASILIAALSLGYFHEFWRTRGVKAEVRAVLLLAAGGNVTVFVLRAFYSLITHRPKNVLEDDFWLSLALFVPVIFLVALAIGGLWLWQVRAVKTLQHEVEIDPLTGILNRRAFDRSVGALLEQMHAGRETMALLLIDLDHFKSINDRFGHPAGDRVLQHFARAVEEELRKSDLFARYGGEEFVILLRGADLHDALQVAEKLRTRIADQVVEWEGSPIGLTVSIGVAATSGQSVTLADLIARADRGLYGAKGSGRNRVVIAAPA